MVKQATLVFYVALLVGCTDADRAHYGATGHAAHIQCYSDGTPIYDGVSTGAVKYGGWNNRYIYFKDAADGMLKQISGNCVIGYLEVAPSVSIHEAGPTNPTALITGPCLYEKFTVDSLLGVVEQQHLHLGVTQTLVDKINETPLCPEYCGDVERYLNENPDALWEEFGTFEKCASVGVHLPKDRMRYLEVGYF